MALIPITPADLRFGAGATASQGTAGETIVPFDFLYLKPGDGKYWKGVCTSADAATVVAVSLCYAAADEPLAFLVINPGVSYIGSNSPTWTKGQNYVIGDTAGQLMKDTDLTAGQFHTICGVAASTTSLLLYNTASGLVA